MPRTSKCSLLVCRFSVGQRCLMAGVMTFGGSQPRLHVVVDRGNPPRHGLLRRILEDGAGKLRRMFLVSFVLVGDVGRQRGWWFLLCAVVGG